MRIKEQQIMGAVIMAALEGGLSCDLEPVGRTALLKVRQGEKQAEFHLELDLGTEMIRDVVGDPDLYIGLLEVAQSACEEIWYSEPN